MNNKQSRKYARCVAKVQVQVLQHAPDVKDVYITWDNAAAVSGAVMAASSSGDVAYMDGRTAALGGVNCWKAPVPEDCTIDKMC